MKEKIIIRLKEDSPESDEQSVENKTLENRTEHVRENENEPLRERRTHRLYLDENRYSVSRGAHKNLRRVERARIMVSRMPDTHTHMMKTNNLDQL